MGKKDFWPKRLSALASMASLLFLWFSAFSCSKKWQNEPEKISSKQNSNNHRLDFMTILKVSFFVICLVATLSGCATSQNAQQQSATPTTISGYIDVGGGKSLKWKGEGGIQRMFCWRRHTVFGRVFWTDFGKAPVNTDVKKAVTLTTQLICKHAETSKQKALIQMR